MPKTSARTGRPVRRSSRPTDQADDQADPIRARLDRLEDGTARGIVAVLRHRLEQGDDIAPVVARFRQDLVPALVAAAAPTLRELADRALDKALIELATDRRRRPPIQPA